MKISTLMGLFFVKGTLVDPKTVVGVSSCETERAGENWGKNDYKFPIPTRKKSVNLVPANQRREISNLMGWFFVKGTLVEPKTVA